MDLARFRTFRDWLEAPPPRTLDGPVQTNLAGGWHEPQNDPEWPAPTDEAEARALLERLAYDPANECIRAGMAELMRAEQTDVCICAAVGNDRMARLMQQVTDLARRYGEACGRDDFYRRWWRRCLCRLAFADAPSSELERITD